MGKRLVIMRHARSSWTSGAAAGHHGSLNKRGRRAAGEQR
jgi:phosphohistidine phosphatase SixA